jgi:hypothetical protein
MEFLNEASRLGILRPPTPCCFVHAHLLLTFGLPIQVQPLSSTCTVCISLCALASLCLLIHCCMRPPLHTTTSGE